MFSLSLFKDVVLPFHPLRKPSLLPAMLCQGQNGLTLVQEYDQLDRLQTVYDLLYAISLSLDHLFSIPATSLMVPSSNGILRKHWQNYVRTWAAQPARKTRSLAGHQKMPAEPLYRTSDGSFMLSWSWQKNLSPEARKSWTEIGLLSGASISFVGQQSLGT